MALKQSTAQLPKHRPSDIYHQGMFDSGPRERHAYVRPRVVLRLSTEKYATREEAGREGKRRLGDQFKRCKFFWTARYWTWYSYD